MKITGYETLEKLSQGKNFTVYRAIKENGTNSFVLKILDKRAVLNFNIINSTKREFHLLGQIDSEYVIKAVDLVDDKDYSAIVLEDINGKPLKYDIKNNRFPFELKKFIELALQITNGLAAVHQQDIIHKDINPTNIIRNSQSNSLKIIDFNIASIFDIKVSYLGNPEKLQGTLPYISPEQTGRMNRRVDQRSDLYSLGVTFYQMLTGKLPFANRNPMEIVYAHLARTPQAPHLINTGIPRILSKLVLKLLAKNPEDRYQSTQGLKHDLEKIQKAFPGLDGLTTLRLGEKDSSGKLQIPEQLYGREKEIQQLLNTYQRVSKGEREMILVSGYAGTGKTALVNEIHKPVTKNRGYFISGKFDQLQRTVPYFAFIQALKQFCQLLLTEKQETLAQWKERILQAVGELGKVLTDMIPQLESVIGKQKEIPEVGGEEERRRFNHVFQCFLQTVSSKEHPLVLFIDDLQWADSAFLSLLQLMMEDKQIRNLLFIGAYRDNEVSPTHPLTTTLEEIHKQGIDIQTIPVENLSRQNVREWLGDTLKTSSDTELEVESLTDLIYQKTHGNAFFTIQFLESLFEENFLRFDLKQSRWVWDIREIKKQNITENVVDLLARKIQNLPKEVREILKLAACIGNVFDLHTLSVISAAGKEEHKKNLEIALLEHLVYPFENEAYKFVHDRIHQAAYSLISEEDKEPLHLKIGRLLLKTIKTQDTPGAPGEVGRRIFDIVNHLNTGIDLIKDQQEKLELARLNLEAAQTAKRAAAYQLGANYVHTILGLLPADGWQQHYDLTLAVYNEAIQTSYLCGNFEEMEKYNETVIKFARDISHTSVAYNHRVISLVMVLNQPDRSVETLLNVFSNLGIDIPKSPKKSEIEKVIHEIDAMLKQLGVESIKDLPLMDDPKKQLVLQLFDMGSLAFLMTNVELYTYAVSKMIALILEYGLTAETPHILILLGIIKENLGDVPGAYQLAEIALDLSGRRFCNEPTKYRSIYKACIYILGNKMHYKKVCKLMIDNYQYALNAGDFETASSILDNYIWCLSRTDAKIDDLNEKARSAHNTTIQLKQLLAASVFEIEISTSANLLGETSNPAFLDVDVNNLFLNIPRPVARCLTCTGNIKQIILAYLFDDYNNILQYIKDAEDNWRDLNIPITYFQSDIYFYIPLAHLQLYTRTTVKDDKDKYLSEAKNSISIMKEMAEFGPVNFLHKYYLLRAELYRVTGKNNQAAEYYDKAVEKAYENEYVNEAALANELAAKFYMHNTRHKLAALYFIEARDCYHKWGAAAKVKHLEENYPKYVSPGTPVSKLGTGTISSASTDTTDELLDVKSIIKASQTLSGEVQLSSLLEKMMQILVENAGAQKGLFIEKAGDRLLIQSEGTKDAVSGILDALPVKESEKLPLSVVNYVAHSKQKLVFDDVSKDPNYSSDDYIQKNQPKSVVCFPISRHDELSAIIYLENNLVEGAFTPARVEVLNTLSSQIAISMENARIYRDLDALNKSLEQKVAERTKKLKDMDEAKSRFFTNISHEFRTPLTLIMGPLEQKLSDCRDKRQQEELQMMLRNSRRLLNLINQLLDLSKLESGGMKLRASRQNIIPFLKALVGSFESQAVQNKLDLTFRPGEEETFLYFDPEKVEKVIINLIANAMKFTPAGGKISVTAAVHSTKQENYPGGYLEITVSDTGIGISTDQLAYVFDRFYQAVGPGHHDQKGTGIGLALAKELVELHHGEIAVHSKEGKGSRFIIRLLLGDAHLKPEEIAEIVKPTARRAIKNFDQTFSKVWPPAGPPEAIGQPGETGTEEKSLVLVVDDNEDVRTYIKGSLEPYFKVIEAADGKEGILRAKEIIPDLIVSDVMMPGTDGFELCRTLKKDVLTCHVPIILLTAKVSDESVLEGLETGADDYITKPFSTMLLAVRVRNLIDLRRQLQLEQKNRMTLRPGEITVSPLDDEFYKKLQDTIETHISDPDFSVEALCRVLDMSQATLYRKIHALTGKSPTLFLRSFRMKRAAQLLEANAGSVSEVADMVGFPDKSYFARCFKEQFHCLPSDIHSPGTDDVNNQKLLRGVQGGGFLEKSPPGRRRQEIILLVEDSEDARNYIRESLEPDYHVVEAVDGSEGIARAMEIIPDLIISDIMMPGMDGYELCRVLKQDVRSCHIPIVMLTAKAAEESRIKGLETGADDYITKPFNTQILRARIKNLIQLRGHLQDRRNREMTLLPVKISEPEADREFMKELNAVIEKNLEEPDFNVEQLAKKLYMGSATLYRKIQALSGEIPSEYIRSFRLRRAAQLFKENFGSVTEVAFEVGFNSRTYFTKCFKEKFHRLPSVYMATESQA